MHELAHIARHQDSTNPTFYDDLDLVDPQDRYEMEADSMASEALVPSGEWNRSRASRQHTAESVLELAHSLGIHPAIVAGRVRHETGNFRILNKFVRTGTVRNLFETEEG